MTLYEGKVYFCTNFGDAQGTLTVDSTALRFTPDALDTINKSEENIEETIVDSGETL